MGVFSWLDWVRKNTTCLKARDTQTIDNGPNEESLIYCFVPIKQRSPVFIQGLKIYVPINKYRLI